MYFNFRYLPVEEAMKFPIIIYRHVRIRRLERGNIIINQGNLSFGMIHLGISYWPRKHHQFT